MANEFLAISDGTFTLSETENKNQFYFYRNDGGVLTDIKHEAMDLYHAYIANKMVSVEIKDTVMNDIYFETSNDQKCMRLTVYNMGEGPRKRKNSNVNQKPNLFKWILNKIFG